MPRSYLALAFAASLGFVAADAHAGLIASDLPYSSVSPALIFDWYGPDVPTSGPTPLAVFLHGAQGTNGSKLDINAGTNSIIKGHLLRNGFSIMAIEYRPYPQFIYPTQIEDAAMALQHFKFNATTYGIDPSRVMVWGLSGGAIIGGKLCYGIDWAKPTGTPQEQLSTRPLAFINPSGLTNFQLMVPWWPGSFFGKQFLYQVDPLVLDEASFGENVIDVTRAFTPPVASCYGTNENPAPVVDPHDVTLMKDFHSKLAQGFPAVAAHSLQLTKSAGQAADDLEHIAEWSMHQMGIDAALDLGSGKPGTGGTAPRIQITGSFAPSSTYSASFTSSTGAASTLYVIVGQATANSPYAGGKIVPAISGVIVLGTDSAGSLVLGGALPPTLPLGIVTYLQFLQSDPGATNGIAFSNAVRVTTGI